MEAENNMSLTSCFSWEETKWFLNSFWEVDEKVANITKRLKNYTG